MTPENGLGRKTLSYWQDNGLNPYDYAETEQPKKRGSRLFKQRTRKPSFVLAVLINAFRMMLTLVLIFGLAGIGVVVGIAKAYVETAPMLDLEKIDSQAQTSFFYDRDGNLITDYKGTENRIMVSIASMPMQLRNAFVAVEDARFFNHSGVDVKRILGAFIKNFVSGSQQGGSTITQQLIKNTMLSSEKSYKRKIQEAYLAMQLERRNTKDEILESYLNTIYLGENYYGVKVAATGYFGKELHDLTLRECAMLAGMTTNPYYYNCRRNLYMRQSDTTDYPAITNNRTNYVLRMMYENQFITHAEYTEALNPETAVVLRESPESRELYPYVHYVEYAVRDVVKTFLSMRSLDDTAYNRNAMERELRTGGYKVYLALDTDIQKQVEQTLYNYKDYPKLRDPGDSVYRARNADGTYQDIEQPQACAVVLDYRSGELKAIVGSRTPPTQRKTLNRAVDMNMPVGSSIKPISVYAPAIELGGGGGSIVYNMPVPIAGWRGADGQDSWPKNYGGSNYRGPETFRTALVKSDNTAAAQALMNYVGVERSVDFLLRLGVSKAHINATPFGVALGSSGISAVEMAVAFGVLGNGGIYQSPLSFLAILDDDNQVIYDSHQQQQRREVFKSSTAWLTIDMLKDAVSKGTGKAAGIRGQTVAGKTGTNSDQKGVFFTGLTGWYAGAVWIGHDNYKSLSSKTTGGNSAAKLWKAFMEAIHTAKGLPNQDIIKSSPEECGLVRVTTCAVSGQLATDACRNDAMQYGTVTDWWPAETAPRDNCQLHIAATICTATNMLAGEYCPAEMRATRGLVVLPSGHPLQPLLNTQYASVISDYLGPYAPIHFTADQNVNTALLSAATCTLHQTPGGSGIGLFEQTLVNDAKTLLTQASLQLAALPGDTQAHATLLAAINNLETLLAQTFDAQVLTEAMSALTQAMAAASQ